MDFKKGFNNIPKQFKQICRNDRASTSTRGLQDEKFKILYNVLERTFFFLYKKKIIIV